MGKGNSHLLGRRGRRHGFRPTNLAYYLIITDAEETERNYFQGLRDSLKEKSKSRIVIKVANAQTGSLIKKALELRTREPQFQQVWIVFDRDQVADFDSIIDEAKKREMEVGWSNPCFEIWLHAYFGSMHNYGTSMKCCEGFAKAFEKKTGKPYEKNAKDIYRDLAQVGSESEAIRLAKEKLSFASKKTNKPSNMAPATTVHILVDEIREKAA